MNMNEEEAVRDEGKNGGMGMEASSTETDETNSGESNAFDVNNQENLSNIVDNRPLTDEERMLLYEKAVQFKRLGSLNHALLSFLGCLQGLQPSRRSKFTMLPQCLTHIAEIYAYLEDFQKAVEFMQAAKLYYETAIIEAGIQVDEYKKETEAPYRPLDLDPCLDEAKRANEYEKLSHSCLRHQKFQLALDYCGKATKLRQQVYGDEHPVTSKSLDLFTLIYAEMGKHQYGEALQKFGDLNKIIDGESSSERKEETVELSEPVPTPSSTQPQSQPIADSSDVNSTIDEKEAIKEDIPVTSQPPVETPLSTNGDEKETMITSPQPPSPSSGKKVTFPDLPPLPSEEEEGYVGDEEIKPITPLQLIIIVIFSAFLAVLMTGVGCLLTESKSCPSRHYVYATLKYWYYVYFVPPAVDDKYY